MKMDHAAFARVHERDEIEPRGLRRAARRLAIAMAGCLTGVALAQALYSTFALLAGGLG